VLTNAGSIVSSRVPTGDILFRVESSDPSELIVPLWITLPAGQTNVPFTLTAVNDKLLDGPQNVTITACGSELGEQIEHGHGAG
jgi:hypothetical protein